jgi:hypothetical protein
MSKPGSKIKREDDNESCSGSESSLDKKQTVTSCTDTKQVVVSKETREIRRVKCVILLVVFMSVLGALGVFFYS